ncbi:hypothetical protein M404DRAFT_18279 [Pisolithus tinctorius Marx 270]|uniref:Uncharacterized protein n=1 Tax=Pisolithus tinctorius Marx 270 TaxID=870435 RepID=A0A0C3PY30_PISTI|nr:hypothetical protein M404DRAFT_18279 [Pisolithus tinctorius Marx 270]
MSELKPITMTGNNDKGWVVINWTQVLDDAIRYNTDEEEEAWLEAERAEREKAKAERAERERAEAEKAAREAEEKRVCKEEERQEAKAGKGSKARARGEVIQVVMDPSCTHCSWAKVVCKFLMDGNKKWVACICCNLSKGKCQWPRDGKDAKASPKTVGKINKGKKRKADEEAPEARPSKKKQAKSKSVKVLDINEPEAGGNRVREAVAGRFLGSEDKLEHLIDMHLGQITNVLTALLDESYGFSMAVSPSVSGSSELDLNELYEEAEWLKAHGKDEEEETKGEDEAK